jgi:hypothetical protein
MPASLLALYGDDVMGARRDRLAVRRGDYAHEFQIASMAQRGRITCPAVGSSTTPNDGPIDADLTKVECHA